MANQSVTLADSIRNIPPVTRFFTISTVIVCFANSLKLIHPNDLICYLPLLLEKVSYVRSVVHEGSPSQIFGSIIWLILQSYRFFTAFLQPVGILINQPFQAILDIYFFYTFANHLESYQGKFRGNFADCLWFTLVTGTIIVVCTLVYSVFDPHHFPVHHQMMLSCVTYIWSRSSKNSLINFLGIIPIKAYYLPLFNLFFKLIVNGYSSFLDSFIGIFGGYLYQCIQSDTLPIYNLFPGSYASFLTSSNNGRRVGNNYTSIDSLNQNDFIEDFIFDKGYLKAPVWLYNLLNYPINNTKRTTAFYPRPEATIRSSIGDSKSGSNEASSTGITWFGNGDNAFRGKGYRLGD